MLIDCDTCTVRGHGCDDCVVTVLLGAPPGWRGSDPTVVPLSRRRPGADAGPVPVVVAEGTPAARPVPAEIVAVAEPTTPAETETVAEAGDAPGWTTEERDVDLVDAPVEDPWSLVELDEVEQQAVRALAEFGLVPPLRHQDAFILASRHVS